MRGLLIAGMLLVSTTSSFAFCSQLSGALVVADDGTFLGTISNKFETRSILNQFGDYGSEFASDSIWNEFGSYGGKFSQFSPFNETSSSPPMIILNRRVIGYLSVRDGENTLSPHALRECE